MNMSFLLKSILLILICFVLLNECQTCSEDWSKFSLTSSSNEVLFEIDENSGNVVVKNTLSVAGVDLLNEINALKNRVAALEAAKPIQSFVNWGTQECPSNTKLLFAGNVMTPRGGGTSQDAFCLPKNADGFHSGTPQSVATDSDNYGQLSTVQFQHPTTAPAFADLRFFKVGCSVCEVSGTAIMMQIGRNSCLGEGWSLVYAGWLFSARQANSQKQTVCMSDDSKPYGTGTSRTNTVRWSFVEFRTTVDDSTTPVTQVPNGSEARCVICVRK